MNGCGRTRYREENLADQDRIFYLEDEFRVPRVRIALSLYWLAGWCFSGGSWLQGVRDVCTVRYFSPPAQVSAPLLLLTRYLQVGIVTSTPVW